MFEKRFEPWTEQGVTAETIEEMYAGAMNKIRENPEKKPAAAYTPDKSFKKGIKISLEERKQRVQLKKAAQVRGGLSAAL